MKIFEGIDEFKPIEKTVKVTFTDDNDGIVANDCFEGIAAEQETAYDDSVVAFGCDVKNIDNYLIIHSSDSRKVDDLVSRIEQAYKKYQPVIEEYENESFHDIRNMSCLQYINEAMKKNSYCIVEADEPNYMHGDISAQDLEKINKGQTPKWAKKVTEIGPRKKELRQSSSHSETAIRSVNTPDGKAKKPYTESDWKADKEVRKASNEKLMKALSDLLHIDSVHYSFDENEVSVVINNYVFRVSPRGLRYYVFRFNSNSILDKKSKMCKSLDEVVSFIKANCD